MIPQTLIDVGAGGGARASIKLHPGTKKARGAFAHAGLRMGSGAAGKTRTFNLLIRSQMLYPIELRLLGSRKIKRRILSPSILFSNVVEEKMGWVGLEPTTNALKGRCSTIELPTRRFQRAGKSIPPRIARQAQFRAGLHSCVHV